MRRLIFVTFIAAALVLLASAGLGQTKKEGIRLFNEARELFDKAQTHREMKRVLRKYERALVIFERVGFGKGVAAASVNLGNVYRHWAQYGKAVSYYEKSLAICRKIEDRRGEGVALNNLGLIFEAWGQYDRAVKSCEQSLDIKREMGDRGGEGKTLTNLGIVYKDWGRYDKAVSYYEKSLAICRELKDRRSEGIVLNNLGVVYEHRGMYEEALDYHQQSLIIHRDLKDRFGEAAVLINLGIVYKDWDQYDKAAAYYEKSLAIDREIKNKKGEAGAFNNLGIVYKNWGQNKKAVSYYEKSLAICRELKDRHGEGNALGNLGIVYKKWGQYDKAVSYYKQSLDIKRELKDRRGEGDEFNNLGNVYRDWGQYDKAIAYYERSLAICREIKDRRSEGNAFNNLGIVYENCGQYDKAVSNYERSLAICREIKNRKGEGRALINLGEVYAQRGERGRAKETIEAGLEIWRKIKAPTKWPKNVMADLFLDEGDVRNAEPLVMEAGYWSTRGRFYLLRSDHEKAKREYEKLLKQAEKNRNIDNLFTANTGLGLTYEGIKDNGKAAEYYRKAVNFTEELRTTLTANQREKFFDVRINGFLRTAPYEGLARVLMRMKKPKDALKGSEHTKARVFSETISRQAQGERFDLPADILKKDQTITDQLAALKKQRRKACEKSNKLTKKALEPQVKELEAKLKAHIKMLRRKYPLFAATKYPEPMDLSQTALKANEWTLSYDVTDTGVLIYLTGGKELVKGLFKPMARKELDELVRKFREPLEVNKEDFKEKLGSFDFASGKKLTDVLLSDVLADLPKDTPVIIVPDDSLGVLPFEMLVLNDDWKVETDKVIPCVTGAEFFGDRNPISYYQSITALTLARTFGKTRKSASKRMVMADPVFDPRDDRLARVSQQRRIALMRSMSDKLMSIKNEMGLIFIRLPLTGELATSLKKLEPAKTDLFVGLKASKPILFEKPLAQYGSMVFATHGYFGKDLPGIQEPVLILTLPDQPEGQDGFLRMSEVMGLKLNADVVALTACQTGLGRRLTGEGTMGMGRAFHYAGAKAVLMSLWSVSEESSVELVESFFRHLKAGKGKLDALRLARKEVRDAGYDHPFFWAAFILAGEVN